jgi:hypothetical protein
MVSNKVCLVHSPVNPNVIDFHALRPDTLIHTLLAAPGSTDGDVEEEVEGFVEGPLFEISRRVSQTFVLESEVVLLIDVGANLLASHSIA